MSLVSVTKNKEANNETPSPSGSKINPEIGYPQAYPMQGLNLNLAPINYGYSCTNLSNLGNINVINREKNNNLSFNMNSNIVSPSSNDYVNIRKFTYPVEPKLEVFTNVDYSSQNSNPNSNFKPFYHIKYPGKPSGTNLKQVFDSLNPPESPESPIKGRKHLGDIVNRINLENILRGRDKRTTLMIRHIPNKYNLYTFLEDINLDFKGTYDVFYLQIW